MSRSDRLCGLKSVPIDPKALQAYNNEYSCLFDGSTEHVSVGNVSELEFDRTDPFSISLWFKTSGSGEYVLFSKRETEGNLSGYMLYFRASQNKFIIMLTSVDNTNEVQASWTQSAGEFNDGNWHQIVWTHSGSGTLAGMRLYLDNTQKTLSADYDNLTTSTVNTAGVSIGSHDGIYKFMYGNIDEVAVWGRELSTEEVAEHYNSGNPICIRCSSGLVGYWRMGDGDTYPTIIDHSDSGNDGTMTNMESGDIVSDTP